MVSAPTIRRAGVTAGLLLLCCTAATAYDDRYLDRATAYADAMIAEGTDRYGNVTSPLFLSMLNRDPIEIIDNPKSALASLSSNGVRQHDRSWSAGNPLHDHQLYELLYRLTEHTGDDTYAAAADASLEWFFTHTQSPVTGFWTWGEHLSWEAASDAPTTQSNANLIHEMHRWQLWDRSYQLAPEAVEAFALGLWNHQINNQNTGDFNRHARYDRHQVETSGNSFPRYAGNMISTWATTYHHTSDEELRAALLAAIERVTAFLQSRRASPSNALPAGTNAKLRNVYWTASELEMVAEIALIVDLLPEPTRSQVFAMLKDGDAVLASMQHDIGEGGRGFLVQASADHLSPLNSNEHNPYTSYWSPGYGYATAADHALLLSDRASYPHLLPTEREIFESWVIQAAERYLTEEAPRGEVLVPEAYAKPIRLLLRAYQLSGSRAFVSRAQVLADESANLLFSRSSPLPRVTSVHHHYETITGGDDLMLAYFKLHQTITEIGTLAGIIQMENAPRNVREDDSTISIVVRRSGGAQGAVAVDWSIDEGTAQEGMDYVAGRGTLRWGDGDAAPKSISLSLINDETEEVFPETLTIRLHDASGGAYLDTDATLDVRITDDDYTAPPLPAESRFRVNFGESPYSTDGTATWQTINLTTGTGTGNSDPLWTEARVLVDSTGSPQRGLSFSVISRGIPADGVSLHLSTQPEDFAGNPFDWFNPAVSEQRETFTFGKGSQPSVWNFRVDGFRPSDIVTFEWVLRRGSKSGVRAVTLSGGASGDESTVLLNAVESDEAPQFVSTTMSGATAYVFELSNVTADGLWVGAANALSIHVLSETDPAVLWREQWFADVENPEATRDDFDYDRDGLSNLLERAFLSDPTSSTYNEVVPSIIRRDRKVPDETVGLLFIYRRIMNGQQLPNGDYTVDDLTYLLEATDSPSGTFARLAFEVVDVRQNAPATGVETVTVQLTDSTDTSSARFVRLTVTSSQE